MKILLVMDPGILIPPQLYGGHERLVYMFAREYNRLGHEVHLLVTEGSEVPNCTIHPLGSEGLPKSGFEGFITILRAWRFLRKHKNNFDLIHNFGRLAYLLPILNHPVLKIMTYGREIDSRNINLIARIPQKRLKFTAPSNDCAESSGMAGEWITVYNAIDFTKYTPVFAVPTDAPLIFLSRLERVKGCHVAIAVAKATGEKLIIAGNISTQPEEIEYFKKEIEPNIDGDQITYVGTVNDEQKNFYLGQAKAMLFPIDIKEAFGLVMAESMACGTPVIGFAQGAVPEIIVNGINGFIVNNETEMVQALKQIPSIDRRECRENAEQRFDVKIISKEYLSLFSETVNSSMALNK